jgi:hypothetical protein
VCVCVRERESSSDSFIQKLGLLLSAEKVNSSIGWGADEIDRALFDLTLESL